MSKIVAWFKAEPAVIIGAAGTLTLAGWQVSQGTMSVDAAIPLVFGVITRFFVSPTD